LKVTCKYPCQAGFGLQYVDIDRSSRSQATEVSYDDILLTFNAKLELFDNFVLRFAAVRNFSR